MNLRSYALTFAGMTALALFVAFVLPVQAEPYDDFVSMVGKTATIDARVQGTDAEMEVVQTNVNDHPYARRITMWSTDPTSRLAATATLFYEDGSWVMVDMTYQENCDHPELNWHVRLEPGHLEHPVYQPVTDTSCFGATPTVSMVEDTQNSLLAAMTDLIYAARDTTPTISLTPLLIPYNEAKHLE